MRVALIANGDDADPGYIGDRLEQLGASLVWSFRDDEGALSRAGDDADAIVLLGSDWSVYDDRRRLSVAAEQALVRRSDERGVPILAICYGAQLVAGALGLAVRRAEGPEIGWKTVESDEPKLVSEGPWFEFHGDCWSDGPQAPSLARTALGPQAFALRRIVAVQFHPEVTPAIARRWMRALPQVVEEAGEDIDRLEEETEQRRESAEARCHVLVDNFLETTS